MARQEAISTPPNSRAQPSIFSISLPNAGRSYRNITEALKRLPEIAQSVEDKTGWKVDLTQLAFKVVSPQDLQRLTVEDLTRRTGVPAPSPSSLSGRLVNLILGAYHRGVTGVYLPSQGAILINEERARGSSRDSVRTLLHHELTHVAQHQAHPAFMKEIDQLVRELQLVGRHGGDLPRDERKRRFVPLMERVQARMSLIEGQAVALQQMYEREYGLNPKEKMGPIEVALGLSSLLIPGGAQKILQYIQGKATFEKIYALGVDRVDGLFQDPTSVDQVFGPPGRKEGE